MVDVTRSPKTELEMDYNKNLPSIFFEKYWIIKERTYQKWKKIPHDTYRDEYWEEKLFHNFTWKRQL